MATTSTPVRPGSNAPAPPAPPPPVIPTSWLAPSEQRLLFVAIVGLIEVSKLWDIIAPYFLVDIEPSWTSVFRVRGLWTAGLWTSFEIGLLLAVTLLRIPMLSPTSGQLLQLLGLLAAYNLGCWFVAEPSAFWTNLNLFGPPSLGGAWFAAKWSLFSADKHLQGVHSIRILPYSTATLNPLSLTYCIPADSQEPLYIPVMFNNSLPDQVSYFVRSLATGHATVETVSGSSMRRARKKPTTAQVLDEDEEDGSDHPSDPLSSLALMLTSPSPQMDVSKIPSVKPADSLALVPQNLASSQSILFLTVNQPSVVTLKSVTDKSGDRFHITPHKEAVIVECPTGGKFVKEEHGVVAIRAKEEQRCVGDEEVVEFQARGVGALRVSWRKKAHTNSIPVESGVIEGIEDEIETVDQLALVRRDRVSKTHTVPMRVLHDKPGRFRLSLTSVTDSLHNTYTPTTDFERVFNVVSRPSVHMECPSPIQVLVNQTGVLVFKADGNGPLPGPLQVKYLHILPEGDEAIRYVTMEKRSLALQVSEAGTYILQEVEGTCSGSVLEPSSCTVQIVPPPTVEMSVTTLHECAMDVGATATFDFTGTPPFAIQYTEQRTGSRPQTLRKTFDSPHGQIVVRPEQEGQYTYTFTGLSDKRYSHIQLDQPPIKQTVHPLANADITNRSHRRKTLFSCSGDLVDLDVEAKGSGPLKLVYVKSWGGGAKVENVTVELASGTTTLQVPVPDELTAEKGKSGKFSISLLSIEDGNGCVRKLAVQPVEVDINRQRPTARFARSENVIVTEGDQVKAQLRLTGEAPWEVTYTRDDRAEKTVKLRDANNHLTFSEKGVYRLTGIKDSSCRGDVVSSESTYEIQYKPRPSVAIVESASLRNQNGVYKHVGLCSGEEDQVALKFDGQPPFEVRYHYTVDGKTSKHSLKSPTNTGILHLGTEPGSHRYAISELGDGNYPSSTSSLTIEHQVNQRPSASFVKQNSKTLCLDQVLQSDAKIRSVGQPPFAVDLSIRKTATNNISRTTIVSEKSEWTLDLEKQGIAVNQVGKYEVAILAVRDESGCDFIVHEGDKLTTTIDVVETARIMAVDQNHDLCVGDTLDFILQGKAPWAIDYIWAGRELVAKSSVPRFTRYAEKEGVFEVVSVAHASNQCKRQVNGLVRQIHPLPSVKIQEGLDSLREGDEPAVFAVSFTGTPPFAFTFTRSEIVGSKPRIMETQTITDIMEDSYTISSSTPGDYQVKWISDKYCQYPRVSKGKGE
ncbi:hypothetical protein P7C73_g21, partial [Tremellales sp. Uapishka_1]